MWWVRLDLGLTWKVTKCSTTLGLSVCAFRGGYVFYFVKKEYLLKMQVTTQRICHCEGRVPLSDAPKREGGVNYRENSEPDAEV